MKEIDLFACEDLAAFFAALVKVKRFKSVRNLSAKLGYSSDRTLGMVIRGQRAMSEKMKSQLADWLGLTPQEFRYLSLLAQKDVAAKKGSPKERAAIAAKLKQARPAAIMPRAFGDAELKELAKWYYHVVIDVVEALGERAGLEAIHKSFKGRVSKPELEVCLKKQVELGRLTESGGIYQRTEKCTYWSDGDVPSAFVREMHRQFIGEAEKSIEGQPLSRRQLITITLPLDKEKIAYAKQRLSETVQSLFAELECGDANAPKLIYQLNVQLFEQADPS